MDLLRPLLAAKWVEKIGGKKTGRYALRDVALDPQTASAKLALTLRSQPPTDQSAILQTLSGQLPAPTSGSPNPSTLCGWSIS